MFFQGAKIIFPGANINFPGGCSYKINTKITIAHVLEFLTYNVDDDIIVSNDVEMRSERGD